MGSSTRCAAALALLALGAQACITGHLLDAARRVEQPIVYHDAFVDHDRLLLGYTALVTDADGQPLAREERRVAIALVRLRRAEMPLEALRYEARADDVPLHGRQVGLFVGATSPNGAAAGLAPPPPFLEIINGPTGRPERLVLHDAEDNRYARFYSAAFTRRRMAPWVYPLLPLSLAIDAATNPVLLLFAPAVIVVGD